MGQLDKVSDKMRAGEVGDLHTRKDSHLSVGINGEYEIHLHGTDLNLPAKPDENYKLVTPMVCTSAEEGGPSGPAARFRKIAKPYLEPGPVFTSTNPNGPEEKGRLQSVADKVRQETKPKRQGVKFIHEDIGGTVA